jgi:hypothetical protein
MSNNVTNTLQFAELFNTTHLEVHGAANMVTLSSWQYVSATWDGTLNGTGVHIYKNATEAGSYSARINGSGTRSDDSTFNQVIGNNQSGTRTFNGSIDEVRVSNIVRSTDWIKATYKTFANTLNTFGSEETNTPTRAGLAVKDTVGYLSTLNQTFRLRMGMFAANAPIDTSGIFIKLQMAQRSGTCDTSFVGETYADVTPSSGVIRYNDNAVVTDGSAISPDGLDPIYSTYSNVAQTYEESNNATNINPLYPNQVGLWEFSLVDNSTSWDTGYCFRIVGSGGGLYAYTTIPEAYDCIKPPDGKFMRAGKATCNGAFRKFYWSH